MSNPNPSQDRQQLRDIIVKGSMRIFPSYQSYMDFYDAIILENRKVGDMGMTYFQVDESVKNGSRRKLGNRDEAIEWFGEAYPTTMEELFSRDEYPLMDEYRKVYEEKIRPRADEIQKNSKTQLEIPTLKYNDIGLGTFDFARASLGLLPLYKYYAIKHKMYVEGVDTYVKKVGDSFKNFLKSDNSPVVIVPQLREGYDEKVVHKAFKEIYDGQDVFETLKKYDLKIGKFSSTIKKTYLYKENVPKPLNAIRIFIYVGGAWTVTAEQFKWTGYTGIGITELMTALGYSVSVHAVFGVGNDTISVGGGKFEKGIRASAVTLKPYTETLHSQRLLYIVSDPSFFRGKEFQNIVKKSQYYNDAITTGLGHVVSTQEIEHLAFKTFGAVDKHWNKDGSHSVQSGMLYYIVANIKNEEEMVKRINDIALTVVNENQQARESMTGTFKPQS